LIDVIRELISKFLKRNDISPSLKHIEDIRESIEAEFELLMPKVKKSQRSFVPQEMSSSKKSLERILALAPVLKDVELEEQRWIIKKIASRLYEDDERKYRR